MIKIDMEMPRDCGDCRFCYTDWTSDDKPDSSAFETMKKRDRQQMERMKDDALS